MSHKLESRLQGEISTTSEMQMIPLNGRKQRGTKEPLDEGGEESEKAGLKQKFKKLRSHHFMANRRGKSGNTGRFPWAPKSLQTGTLAMKLKDTCSWKESCDKSRLRIKQQRHHFANKGPSSQSYSFSSSWVQI